MVKEEANTAPAPIKWKARWGIVYKNERLQKVIDDLHEYFGINIQVAEAVKPARLTLILPVRKIEEVLEDLTDDKRQCSEKRGYFFIDAALY